MIPSHLLFDWMVLRQMRQAYGRPGPAIPRTKPAPKQALKSTVKRTFREWSGPPGPWAGPYFTVRQAKAEPATIVNIDNLTINIDITIPVSLHVDFPQIEAQFEELGRQTAVLFTENNKPQALAFCLEEAIDATNQKC